MKRFIWSGRLTKVIAVIVMAIPWIVRDHLAESLDRQSEEMREVLLEQDAQQQREQEATDQRSLYETLARIELGVQRQNQDLSDEEIEAESERMWRDSIAEDADALERSAQTLEDLASRVPLSQPQEVVDAVERARAVAQTLKSGGDDTGNQSDLFDEWVESEDALAKAYDQVAARAEDVQKQTAESASFFRIVAWVVSAIGAVVLTGEGWLSAFGIAAPADRRDDRSTASPV